MNLTNLAASLRENMTTIEVHFITDGREWTEKKYTYKCDRFLADTLTEGDVVVVHAENNHNYKHTALAVVKAIHDEPDIDLDAKQTLKWVMCSVPIDFTKAKQAEDEKLGKQLRVQHAKSCRERALSMLGLSPEEAKQLLEKQK